MSLLLRCSLAAAVAVAAVALPVAAAAAAPSDPVATPAATAGRFTPVTPVRILDTRIGLGAPKGTLAGRSLVPVLVRGTAGVPADATAVMLNVTVLASMDRTEAVAVPCGLPLPSPLAIVAQHANVPSAMLTMVAIGSAGTVCVGSGADGTHVIADLQGWFGPSGSGGFTAVSPSRLLDTRNGLGAPKMSVAANSVLTLQVGGRGGIPASAKAALLNVTATETRQAGYVTVFPCDQPRPTASNLNFVAGSTVPNLVPAGLTASGTTCLFASAPVDLVVDVSGSFGEGGLGYRDVRIDSEDEIFLFPDNATDLVASSRIAAGQVVPIKVRGQKGVPADASAVTLEIVGGTPFAAGYFTAYPCDQPRPTASMLNTAMGELRSNLVVVPIAADGTVCVYSSAASVMLVLAPGTFG